MQLAQELDAHEIDMLHVDCRDNDKVFEDIAAIRKISSTPIDLHIISAEPEKYFDRIEELKIDYVSFQYEELKQIPQLPAGSQTKFGLSIISSTPVTVFDKVKDSFSFIMLMATVPGQSGGEFNRESFQRIIEFKSRYPKVGIEVDGGVNDEIAYILRLLGVNTIVTGSFLMNHESLGAGMLSFHKKPTGHKNFTVAEFATPAKYLPVITNEQLSFKTVLQTIDKYALGFVLITDTNNKLTGIISNADVRRALLKNLEDLNAINPHQLINSSPVVVAETATVADVVRLLNSLNFIVLFLPVVDENKVLKGAVLLNNLTRV